LSRPAAKNSYLQALDSRAIINALMPINQIVTQIY